MDWPWPSANPVDGLGPGVLLPPTAPRSTWPGAEKVLGEPLLEERPREGGGAGGKAGDSRDRGTARVHTFQEHWRPVPGGSGLDGVGRASWAE